MLGNAQRAEAAATAAQQAAAESAEDAEEAVTKSNERHDLHLSICQRLVKHTDGVIVCQ